MSFEAGLGGVAGFKDRLEAVRADGGVGFEGTPFVPYSSAYKKGKREGGRPLEKVDLKSTGQMLNDLALEGC